MAWSDMFLFLLPDSRQLARRALFRARRERVQHDGQAQYHAAMATYARGREVALAAYLEEPRPAQDLFGDPLPEIVEART